MQNMLILHTDPIINKEQVQSLCVPVFLIYKNNLLSTCSFLSLLCFVLEGFSFVKSSLEPQLLLISRVTIWRESRNVPIDLQVLFTHLNQIRTSRK